MGAIQALAVKRKVENIGAARCDICEEDRGECIDFPAGFFGACRGTVCDSCLALMLRMCTKEAGGDA